MNKNDIKNLINTFVSIGFNIHKIILIYSSVFLRLITGEH